MLAFLSGIDIKATFYAVAVSALIGLGWWTRGLAEDRQDLAELRALNAAIESAMNRESAIAGALEKRLSELQANQTVIEREKLKIIDRPIYHNDCLDADGVLLVNRSKTRPDPAKPADHLP